MTTRYCNQLHAFVPQPQWAGGNILAACFGEGREADLQQFCSITHVRDGAPFHIISTSVTDAVRQALQAHVGGGLTLPSPPWLSATQLAAGASVLAEALVLLNFDPEQPPAYHGQTILALNCDRAAIEAAYGMVPAHE